MGCSDLCYTISKVKKTESDKPVHKPNKEKITVQRYRVNIHPSCHLTSHERAQASSEQCNEEDKLVQKLQKRFPKTTTKFKYQFDNKLHLVFLKLSSS